MLLWKSALPLVGQHIKTLADQQTCFPWKNDLVNITESSSNVTE